VVQNPTVLRTMGLLQPSSTLVSVQWTSELVKALSPDFIGSCVKDLPMPVFIKVPYHNGQDATGSCG